MKAMRSVRGIVPVLVTPLNAAGGIDAPALRRLVEFLVSQPIGGLWVLGTGGEDMNLAFRKRLEVARVVTETNAGRVPIVLGASFFALEDTLEFMREASGLEFDAHHLMPYHPLLGFRQIEWWYRRVADASPRPLWMYSSANWCKPLTPAFVAGLRDHPNIAGIKYSTKDAVAVFQVASLAGEGFQVITAVAGQLYGCLALGSGGHTSSLGSCLPEPMIEVHRLFAAGRHEEAREAQRRLNRLLDAFSRGTKGDNFLQAAEEKYVLSLRGICGEHVSSYYRGMTPEEKAGLEPALREIGLVPGPSGWTWSPPGP